MMFFDFDELDALEAPSQPAEKVTAASTNAPVFVTCVEDSPAYAAFDFDELEAVEASVGTISDQAMRNDTPVKAAGPRTVTPVKTADPETEMKIQQALADAVRRRRKAAGLAEENVADSDLATKFQKAVEEARLRKENKEPKELSKIEQTVQKNLAAARERQNGSYDANSHWNSGGWWPWPLKSQETYIATDVQDGDGWDLPIQVGATKLQGQVQKALDEAKVRQSQTYFASTEPSVPHSTVEQIQKAQMVAESRSYIANELLNAPWKVARRTAPYKPKTDESKLKRAERWADQTDSDAEAEGASPRQRGGG
jgi:hypothetical protein